MTKTDANQRALDDLNKLAGKTFDDENHADHEFGQALAYHFETIRTALTRPDDEEKLNSAYTQRMIAVRMLAVMSGCNYGLGKDDNEDWDDEWRTVVYIDLPQGQVSWHIAPHDLHLFDDFPQYKGKWDGNSNGSSAEFAKKVHPDNEVIRDDLTGFINDGCSARPEDKHHALQALEKLKELEGRDV